MGKVEKWGEIPEAVSHAFNAGRLLQKGQVMLKSVDMSALPAKSISFSSNHVVHRLWGQHMPGTCPGGLSRQSWQLRGWSLLCYSSCGPLLFFQPRTAINHVNSGSEDMSGFCVINSSFTHKSLLLYLVHYSNSEIWSERQVDLC